MSNSFFQFKQFIIQQDRCAMKVTTDSCLFGAWAGERVGSTESRGGSTELRVVSRESLVGTSERRVLDIGTGTGLLTLMLAQKTNALLDAIEIDKDAFEQATENSIASPWKDRINAYHGDARHFNFLSKYDVIISNPPFYENELKPADEKKIIAHHDGLSLEELLAIIKKNLSADGRFFLLLPYKRNEEAEKHIRSFDLTVVQKMFVRQSFTHDYFRIMIEGTHAFLEQITTTKEISIWDDYRQYTPDFIGLLKDYYLYLY